MHSGKSGTNGGACPWGCVHDLADFAARLGRSSASARRIIEGDAALRSAARCFSGTVWVPADALREWWERQPGLGVFVPRVVRVREARGRVFSETVVARSEGEARRKAAESREEASA